MVPSLRYPTRVLLVSVPCACGCARFARVTLGPDGLEIARRDAGRWILRAVWRGDERLDVRVWSRECMAVTRTATPRRALRPITEPSLDED